MTPRFTATVCMAVMFAVVLTVDHSTQSEMEEETEADLLVQTLKRQRR